jgi:hypothetical protein
MQTGCLIASHGVHCGPDKDGRLLPVVEASHGSVLSELAVDDVESDFRAIARLSVHVAAMRSAVYPQAPPDRAGRCLTAAREAEWALHLYHRCLTGEAIAVKLPLAEVYGRVTRALDALVTAEHELAAWIDAHRPAHRSRLASRYLARLTKAPTRPHPRAPQGGAYRIAFGFHARWDRFLDTVDARIGVGHGFLREPGAEPAHRDASGLTWPGPRNG